MNKKLMSALFVGALLLGSTSTLSSCKDYDDDIQANTDAIASLKKELSDKISTLENSVKEVQAAKDSAAAALKTAQDALAAAQGKADSATVAALEKRVADLESQYKVLSEAVKKLQDGNYEERLAKVEKDLAAAIAAINAGSGSTGDLTAIQKVLDDMETELADIIGHRLTSVVFVAKNNINGVPAIKFESLTYQDSLKYVKRAPWTGVEDSIKAEGDIDVKGRVDIKTGNKVYVNTGVSTKTVEYTLNPTPFVQAENITMPYFNCMVSENDIELTRLVADTLAFKNSPIMPVENQTLTVDEKGVLKLKIKKVINYDMNKEWVNNANVATGGGNATERFYMAQLVVPVAKAQWTTAEKEAPEVVSDWARISESVIRVYIENAKAGAITPATAANFPTDKDINNRYVHYHDSLTAYDQTKEPTRLKDIDHYLAYNVPVNLDTLVRVCNMANHNKVEDYKAMGLTFRYRVARGQYIIGSNKTNEQEFATVEGNILTSRVYTVNSVSQTAVGRQPIIAAELVDTVNHKLVCLRYIKIKWDKTVPVIQMPDYTIPSQVVSCKTLVPVLGTQEMNEQIYHLAKAGGMTKEEFHTIYPTMEIKSFTKDGTNILTDTVYDVTHGDESIENRIYCYVSKNNEPTYMLKDYTSTAQAESIERLSGNHEPDVVVGFVPDEKDNTSFNFVIRLDPKAIGTVKKGGSTYRLTVVFKDATGANGDLEKTFIIPVNVPNQNFTYQGTYWDGGSRQNGEWDTYNINPINFLTVNDQLGTVPNAFWNDGIITSVQPTGLKTTSAYSQIKTDLINGYIYKKTTQKPTSVDQLIQQIHECSEISMQFDSAKFKNYSHLSNYVVENITTNNGEVKSVLKKKNTLDKLNTTSAAAADIYATATSAGTNSLSEGANPIYYQKDDIAGWIDGKFGATAAENDMKDNLDWKLNEAIGSGNNVCSAVIQLAEKDRLHGTPAANALVGKKVPVKLVVTYNQYNIVPVDEFEVYFINPLTVDGFAKGAFEDNNYDGSWLNAGKGYTMQDWNKYPVSSIAPLKSVSADSAYAEPLYHFYAVQSIVWDLDHLTTDLTWNGTSYEQKDGVTNGVMPTNSSLKAYKGDSLKTTAPSVETNVNPNWIVYFNNGGSPVNKDYHIFVKTTVNYKWGSMERETVAVTVKKRL